MLHKELEKQAVAEEEEVNTVLPVVAKVLLKAVLELALESVVEAEAQ